MRLTTKMEFPGIRSERVILLSEDDLLGFEAETFEVLGIGLTSDLDSEERSIIVALGVCTKGASSEGKKSSIVMCLFLGTTLDTERLLECFILTGERLYFIFERS